MSNAEAILSVVPAATVVPKRRKRHLIVGLSFLLLVLLPFSAAVTYIYVFAADQYHSHTAFSVRSEEFANPLDILGAFTQTGGSTNADSAILNDFILSQPMVQIMDAELNLLEIFNRSPDDVVFSLGDSPSIEDLVQYWARMVSVSVDSSSGVIDLETRAFSAADAQIITEAIIRQSIVLINDLSRIAREDATKFAHEDLVAAEARLKDIRLRVREFRNETQIINPEADLAAQMGVLSVLENRLADALVEHEVLLTYATDGDARVTQIDSRIRAIRTQIAAEKGNIGAENSDGRPLSEVIGQYEELLVDLEFSQTAYTAALIAEEQARAEARRQSRYLAIHIPATLSEEAQYPQRFVLSLLAAVFLFSAWAVLVLIGYNVRDRR
ncbi:MAG: hypothetical protein JKY31_05920 [Rhodobacteraceae bacterium]|nr:hypothetical protein [Paracoccaceae bacterium]